MWNNTTYQLEEYQLLDNKLIKKYTNKFYDDIISKLKEDQHIIGLFRIKLKNNQYATLSHSQKINNNPAIKEALYEYLINRFELSNEEYKTTHIINIIFSYGIREGKIIPTLQNFDKNINHHIYYNNKLPIAFKAEEYGIILSKVNNYYTISLQNNATIILRKEEKNNDLINHIEYFKKGKLLFFWKDTISGDKLIREIGKTTLYYENNKITLVKVIKKTTGIKNKVAGKSKLNQKIIIMDLETIIINKIQIPYLIKWYDGKNNYSYFIEDNFLKSSSINIEKNIQKIVILTMSDICRKKYRNYKIYFHNFSKFDSTFLLKYLANIGTCDPQIYKGKIINIRFQKNDSNYLITFMDSFLLLPAPLKDLCKSFDTSSVKDIFPYLLSDINYLTLYIYIIKLNYIYYIIIFIINIILVKFQILNIFLRKFL
jgi:hypothetical protein